MFFLTCATIHALKDLLISGIYTFSTKMRYFFANFEKKSTFLGFFLDENMILHYLHIAISTLTCDRFERLTTHFIENILHLAIA